MPTRRTPIKTSSFIAALICAATLLSFSNAHADADDDYAAYLKSLNLPPASGKETPMVKPILGDDQIWHQSWFSQSFLDLREDYAEAKAQGKRFAVIFEQRGCGYCTKMHNEVLAKKYINDYVRENFHIVQIDLWGGREVTDLDGKVLTEKKLARRWRIYFTPGIVFFKEDLSAYKGKWGRELEVLRMALGFGAGTFFDIFTWIKHKVYLKDNSFQRFHLFRFREREALKAEAKKEKKPAL